MGQAKLSDDGYKQCVTCRYPITGLFYGAGDGTGSKFECAGCYWYRRYEKLRAGLIILLEATNKA